MKIFIHNVKNIVLFSCLLSNMISVWAHEPSNTIAAYNNKISQISYSVGSHDQHAITFVCQKDPICMYTPLSYEDSDSASLKKTYFLPRTECADAHMRYFYDNLHESLKLVGIDLHIDAIKHLNYGLRVSFTMQPDNAYDIVKLVNDNNKTVSFSIVAKI